MDRGFWQDRRVFLTGHTGFKGTWLSLWLETLGAEVTGLSLAPATEPSLFARLAPFARQRSVLADIRDAEVVRNVVHNARPQVVIHMAAQSLVRRSYSETMDNFAINVMGTVHLLEALRGLDGVQAVLVITTDKVYENVGKGRAFIESDPLGGHDPYAASKAACEVVTASYARSFFADKGIAVATARAGNVIGGGDWAEDRIIPDLWRAVRAGRPLRLRNPHATRPWQHVLEPLAGYLAYVEELVDNGRAPRALNFGPPAGDMLTVAEVAEIVLAALDAPHGWTAAEAAIPQPLEAPHLALDPGLAMKSLNWRPRLATAQALRWTAEWYRAFDNGADARTLCRQQLQDYDSA
jgi:CDP-glucose 4,6-dehydratase